MKNHQYKAVVQMIIIYNIIKIYKAYYYPITSYYYIQLAEQHAH